MTINKTKNKINLLFSNKSTNHNVDTSTDEKNIYQRLHQKLTKIAQQDNMQINKNFFLSTFPSGIKNNLYKIPIASRLFMTKILFSSKNNCSHKNIKQYKAGIVAHRYNMAKNIVSFSGAKKSSAIS